MNKKLISIVTPCYNESDNILPLYERICKVIDHFIEYQFEIIFIDNSSTDDTVSKLKVLANKNKNVKIIINTRNFGHIRSPYYGLLQARGDAVIYLASDLQDPPEVIPEFLRYWEEGYKLVMAVKPRSKTSPLFHFLRKAYYRLLNKISDIDLLEDSTGFGLYDKVVIEKIRSIGDPYPYLRGIICDLGYEIKKIIFNQPKRGGGISKNNLYSLYDIGILGIVNHSKIPLRLAVFIGFVLGLISITVGIVYFFLKLIYWDSMSLGVAPMVIGGSFFIGMQFLFLGILGEYILVIHTRLQNRPIVVEKERINF